MLAGKTYCPILHTRVAELKGLEQLPDSSKDLLFPIIVARPWPNAKKLEKTWEKIAAAFGERRFGLDLDHFMRTPRSDKDAAQEFAALFDPAGGYANYYEQVAKLPFAIPVLQLTNGQIPDLDEQAAHIRAINQGAVLRVTRGSGPHANVVALQVLEAIPDLLVVVDIGWDKDLLSQELWASGIIAAVSDSSPGIEIVVAGSSFPDAFKPLARAEVLAQERAVFEALTRRHNAITLTYGDWGSTRAPREPSPMRIVKRIDLPLSREWICFRDEGLEDYEQIARRVTSDHAWPTELNIWGTYLIEGTAEGIPGGIRGQAAAAAARINIHLYRQAYFGEPTAVGDGDEPFED